MRAGTPQPVTVLLTQWKAGNPGALSALVRLVYAELHRLAGHYLRSERRAHTLQSTALVNEAYLRLVGQEPGDIDNRAYFIGVVAHVMREVLVDHARARRAAKRDGGDRVELRDEDHPLVCAEAMKKPAELDLELCRIAEMRLFGGLTVEESATATGLSLATVKREWAVAKARVESRIGTRGSERVVMRTRTAFPPAWIRRIGIAPEGGAARESGAVARR